MLLIILARLMKFETELKYLELLDEKYPKLNNIPDHLGINALTIYIISVLVLKKQYTDIALESSTYMMTLLVYKCKSETANLKNLLMGYLYSGKLDEAKRLLNEIRHILEFKDENNNHFTDYWREYYLWEAKFYEAEIKLF